VHTEFSKLDLPSGESSCEGTDALLSQNFSVLIWLNRT
jgi:hypothetical protein